MYKNTEMYKNTDMQWRCKQQSDGARTG